MQQGLHRCVPVSKEDVRPQCMLCATFSNILRQKECYWSMPPMPFNSLNRRAALHDISSLCPPLMHILPNTYRVPVQMIIAGSGEISSTEGTTQGDPLAMAMYALATLPLIHRLQDTTPTVQQVWYADDATTGGSCLDLRAWWGEIQQYDPLFGYYPNSSRPIW